ncbi:hypothetical protein K1719_021814 [Acacia pycnantha]|nr:hypothetical protein K1719_021814 [Acacia pycnantha]
MSFESKIVPPFAEPLREIVGFLRQAGHSTSYKSLKCFNRTLELKEFMTMHQRVSCCRVSCFRSSKETNASKGVMLSYISIAQ